MDAETGEQVTGTEETSTETVPFIEGEQIYLRKITPEDAHGNYLEWINDQEITRHLASGFFPSTNEDLESYIRDKNSADDTLFLAIVLKETGEHIGNIKIDEINWIDRRGKIGLLIGERNHWGKGIATEAIQLLSTHAFNKLNLRKVIALCDGRNEGSIKAFKKVGFAEEGRQKDHVYRNGSYDDWVLLALFRSEFN